MLARIPLSYNSCKHFVRGRAHPAAGRITGSAGPRRYPGPIVEAAGTAAPAVVAVVVARNPGPWFDDVLDGLALQDYPNLSVLVVDAGSAPRVRPRVAARLAGAYVRRLDTDPGQAAAANEALTAVEGADFLLFCHDDVVLDRSAVRHLVEEAFRANAGIVGPKIVSWRDPGRLLAVGLSADVTGAPAPLVERGELDQAQRDGVREVLASPGACLLVRADLFATLGGFDDAVGANGEDLDLCWRAAVAGARTVVQPAARVRHLEARSERLPPDERRRDQARRRLRTLLVTSSPGTLARVLPRAAVLTVLEAVYAVLVGRPRQAGHALGAWLWNLARSGDVRRRRAALAAVRSVPDGEIRRLQVGGSTRVNTFLRGQRAGGQPRLRSVADAGRGLAVTLRQGDAQLALIVWVAVVVVLLAGSRHLITDAIPAVGHLPAFAPGDGAGDLVAEWASGWRRAGLGSDGPAPTAFGLLGLLGALLFGQMALLRTVLVLGLVAIGIAGGWRLTRPLGSVRGRLVGLLVYVAAPLAWNALATGRLEGLVLYAAAPWLLARLHQATGLAPWGSTGGERGPAVPDRPLVAQAVALGLVVALAAVLVPWVAMLVVVVALALAVGSLLTGDRVPVALAVVAAGGLAVAAVLHVPWSLDLLPSGGGWSAWPGLRPQGGAGDVPGLGQLLRFETGPIGAAPLGWAFVVAAALPLVIGRGWRFAWAVRAWSVAIAVVLLQWAAERGWLPFPSPVPEVGLAPAAAALALAAALGVVAFEVDLRGFGFGARQLAVVVAALALVAGALPVLGAAVGGRWDLPSGDLPTVLSVLDDEGDPTAFRVLWLGDPEAMPVAGWELDGGVAWALTEGAVPAPQDLWAGSPEGDTGLVADAVRAAAARRTTRLGRLLAPFAVRYVIVPQRLAPEPFDAPAHPVPPAVPTVLSQQLDLEERRLNEGVLVYENVAWAPARSALPRGDLPEDGGLAAAAATSLRDGEPVLPGRDGVTSFAGDVPAESDVLWSAGSSDRWRLEVAGAAAPRREVFGWANGFAVDDGGAATLSYATPGWRVPLLVLQVLLWLAAVQFVVVVRRWGHRDDDADPLGADVVDPSAGEGAATADGDGAAVPTPVLAEVRP